MLQQHCGFVSAANSCGGCSHWLLHELPYWEVERPASVCECKPLYQPCVSDFGFSIDSALPVGCCCAICSQWFSPEMPEWDMEKYRFYLDLPGDFWESGTLLRYLREREVQVRAAAAAPVPIICHSTKLCVLSFCCIQQQLLHPMLWPSMQLTSLYCAM